MASRPALPLTGERTVPGVWHENYWFRRHEVVYRWWASACTGARVLDAGCGEGYGAALLSAGGAAGVLALDLDLAALRHAASAYRGIGLTCANLVALPLADRSVDVVVSGQTIEHVWDQDLFVRECARVLRPGGRLLVSTPNRRTFPPGNVFHHRELDAGELQTLLGRHLDGVRVVGVRHGRRLRWWSARHGDVVQGQIAGAPSTWDKRLAALVRSVTTDDFVLRDGEVDTSLDLVASAVAG